MDLNSLPDDVLVNVYFPQLSLDTLRKLCSTSTRFRKICETDRMWDRKLLFDFPEYHPFKPANLTYPQFYAQVITLIPVTINTSGIITHVRYIPSRVELILSQLILYIDRSRMYPIYLNFLGSDGNSQLFLEYTLEKITIIPLGDMTTVGSIHITTE